MVETRKNTVGARMLEAVKEMTKTVDEMTRTLMEALGMPVTRGV